MFKKMNIRALNKSINKSFKGIKIKLVSILNFFTFYFKFLFKKFLTKNTTPFLLSFK